MKNYKTFTPPIGEPEHCDGCSNSIEDMAMHKWTETTGTKMGQEFCVCDLCWFGAGATLAVYGEDYIGSRQIIQHINGCTLKILETIKKETL